MLSVNMSIFQNNVNQNLLSITQQDINNPNEVNNSLNSSLSQPNNNRQNNIFDNLTDISKILP